MAAYLVLLFLVVPFVELYVLIQVGQEIGAASTILVLVVVSVVGGWLVKREGVGVVRRAQAQMQAGRVPGREIVDGVLILFAGALLLTPGFVTDIVGILLLLPPVRAVIRAAALKRLGDRVVVGVRHLDARGHIDTTGRIEDRP